MTNIGMPLTEFKHEFQTISPFPSSHYFGWDKVPPHLKTKKQLLKTLRRLKPGATKQGSITCIFDHQQHSKTSDEQDRLGRTPLVSMPAVSFEIARFQTTTFGWTNGLDALERAGQAASMNLYNQAHSEAITSLTEPEARTLLYSMCFDYSHPIDFITKCNGESSTWKWQYSRPDLVEHLLGQQIFGPKYHEDGRVRIMKIDMDRHSANITPEYQKSLVLRTVDILLQYFPEYRWAAEINPSNGSVGLFGVLWDFLKVSTAQEITDELRETLKRELPDHPWDSVEIYPSAKGGKGNLQIYAPLRGDKTFITHHVVPKVRIRSGHHKGKWAYSCADYLNWVSFEESDLSKEVVEQHLDEALARPLPVKESKRKAAKVRKPRPYSGTQSELGPWKGRTVARIMQFFDPACVLPDDSVTEYTNVIAHVAKAQGCLDAEETTDLIMEALDQKEDTSFSDRLSDNLPELERVIRKSTEKVFLDGGYQPDKARSARIWAACAKNWAERGWLLHDPSTWEKKPSQRLVWNATHERHVQQLAAIANADVDKMRLFYEKVLVFTNARSELALSKVGELLESCGIKGGSQEKRVQVRKYLEGHGLILLRHNYYCDEASGYRHGNFYICGLDVEFTLDDGGEERVAIPYLSLFNVIDDDEDTVLVELRRLHCDQRYWERVKWLKQRLRSAA